jgi:hypothetical protein
MGAIGFSAATKSEFSVFEAPLISIVLGTALAEVRNQEGRGMQSPAVENATWLLAAVIVQ